MLSKKHSHTYLTSILGAVLTVLGYFISPVAGIYWMVIVNRSLALFVISVTCVFIINRKISETKILLLNSSLEQLATRDSLTNIGNRLLFKYVINKEIDKAVRYNRSFSLISFDIDHFKKINDSFGHDIGDKVLTDLTRLVGSYIRQADSFFRIGGEEFAVILTETELCDAQKAAEEICRKVSDCNDGFMNSVTISLGVTSINENDDIDKIMKRADIAMYNAKESGRNQVCVFTGDKANIV